MFFELIIQLLADHAYEVEKLRLLEELLFKYTYKHVLNREYQERADRISQSIEYHLEKLWEMEEIITSYGIRR